MKICISHALATDMDIWQTASRKLILIFYVWNKEMVILFSAQG